MVCKLIGLKYGSFTSKDTGEVIEFTNVFATNAKALSEYKKGTYSSGYIPATYKGKYLARSASDYECLIGTLVDLRFDLVPGFKEPVLVDILSVPEEIKK